MVKPSETGPDTPAVGVARKKFATPPVKVACLACRASRTRCDGGHPCTSCKTKARECVYQPSKRGGARVRKRQRDGAEPTPVPSDAELNEMFLADSMPAQVPKSLPLESYIDPGAGLAHLQDWFQDSDLIFDSLFSNSTADQSGSEGSLVDINMAPVQNTPMVRTYCDDDAILDAYYVFIHPYFPILPPPSHICVDRPVPRTQNQVEDLENAYESPSPAGLAIAAILALLPCADDAAPQSQESIVFRRKYAHYLAQSALESIEAESEIPDSSFAPAKALEAHTLPMHQPFHCGLPMDLESIVALNILSVYEYAQRGNLKKMQNRAGQALAAALAASLHLDTDESDVFGEAKSRVWWMTYTAVCQASIVNNSKPSFDAFAPSFTRKLPMIAADGEAYSVFLESQRAILSATQFVSELKANPDRARIHTMMSELELYLEPLNTLAESWDALATTMSPVTPTEEVVSRSLRAMARIKLSSARIKLHRYSAFFDVPVFSGNHCDLKSTTSTKSAFEEGWPSCSCAGLHQIPDVPGLGDIQAARDTSLSAWSSPSSEVLGPPFLHSPTHGLGELPFGRHQSAKICLKSAFNIAAAFETLPYPNPTGEMNMGMPYLSPSSTILAPRTMPSFACCAMQCAYTLLMVHRKTKSLPPEGSGFLVDSLLLRLQSGLMSILSTMENYGAAFEALGGMRDQVRSAVDALSMANNGSNASMF